MRVFVFGEYSGRVCLAFLNKGHDAMSCDFLPTEANVPHYQGDGFDVLDNGWDMLIAHPDCTRLCNSGVRWLHQRNLWTDMEAAAIVFKRLLNWPGIPRKCIENPIPHKYALKIIGRKYDQIIQPWQFGYPETKATCLWLENLSKLKPTNIVSGREGRIWKMPPSKNRPKLRSLICQGHADAMAAQWG